MVQRGKKNKADNIVDQKVSNLKYVQITKGNENNASPNREYTHTHIYIKETLNYGVEKYNN